MNCEENTTVTRQNQHIVFPLQEIHQQEAKKQNKSERMIEW